MKILFSIFLAGIVVVIGTQLYELNDRRLKLLDRAEIIEQEFAVLDAENKELQADITYFSNFDNLIKEFKTIFNYRKPGEKLIIVIPKE